MRIHKILGGNTLKKSGKIIALMLSLIMVFTLLAGCTNKSVEVNTNNTADSEDIKADYVVIGGGAAGLMCALELSSKGKVVLLEKMPALGGSPIRSNGFL